MFYKLILALGAVSLTLAAPADYDLLSGIGYYKHHQVEVSWQDAVDICMTETAHLIIINSQSEIDAVYQQYANLGVWVGVRRIDEENYVTIFDEPLSSTGYSTWFPGYPRGEYVTWPWVGVSRNEGLYNLYSTVILTFICEIEL